MPHYLAMGVDYEFIMQSNPYEMRSYDKAFKLRQQLEDERDWRMGQYNMSAFGVILGSAFGNKDIHYMEEPLLTKYEKENKSPDEVLEIKMHEFVCSFQGTELPPTIIDIHKGEA